MILIDNVEVKCPKCGNADRLRVGPMSLKDGKMTVSSVECLECGYKDDEVFTKDVGR